MRSRASPDLSVGGVALGPGPTVLHTVPAAGNRALYEFGGALCTLFCHGRAPVAGQTRLVTVSVRCRPDGTPVSFADHSDHNEPLLDVRVLRPGSFMRNSRLSWRGSFRCPPLVQLPRGALSFYAGQPDPEDESHFTIDYEIPNGSGTIDGWLQPDDTVRLTVRDGPAARPAPK